jgi:acetyl esterase/lipase
MTLDPAMFLTAAADAETVALNDVIEQFLATQPTIDQLRPQTLRDARESGASPFGPIVRIDWATERRIPGPAGEITIRQFIPETVNGVFLHLHGGGFMLGRAHHQDVPLSLLATQGEVAVVSVDYRLAPEDPYPAGPDDCEAAAVWLAAHGKREFGTDRLLIGGESAGANLAAATLLRMRDRHRCTGFAGAVLTFGVFDISMTPSARRWGNRNLIINTPIMQWFSDHYVSAERRHDPDVSPLYADLSDLPPAIFTVGTLDPLLDDTLFMHARWLAAGNRAELQVYAGAIHGFIAFPLEIARRASERIVQFVRQA